jgi:iron complex transport system substrate-binding protein
MMKKYFLSTVLLLSALSPKIGATPLPDALGRKIVGPNKAVISLSPAVTELLYDMGLQNKIIGVSDFSDYPAEAKSLPNVGPYTHANLEAIVALKPDLVIVPQEGPEDIRVQMDRLPLAYAVVNMRKIDEIGKTAAQLGSWLGEEKKGKDYEANWRDKVTRLFNRRATLIKKGSLHALIEIQNEPLIVAGADTFLDQIVTRCGAQNVVREKDYPKISLETLVKKQIDLIFLADYFAKDSEKESVKKRWKKFPATEDSKIFVLDPDTTSRPGPRLLTGIQKICEIIAEQSI